MFLSMFIDVLTDDLCLKRINCTNLACAIMLVNLYAANTYSAKLKILKNFQNQVEKEVGIIINNKDDPRFIVESIELFHYDENSNIDDENFFKRRNDC